MKEGAKLIEGAKSAIAFLVFRRMLFAVLFAIMFLTLFCVC